MATRPKTDTAAATKPGAGATRAGGAKPPRTVAAAKALNAKSAPPTTASKAATDNTLKKKDLIEKVLIITGAKKAQVRDIVEATLTVLGDALTAGAMLNLPPFGKAKVSRATDVASGKAMTVKLRRGPVGGSRAPKGASGTGKEELADAED